MKTKDDFLNFYHASYRNYLFKLYHNEIHEYQKKLIKIVIKEFLMVIFLLFILFVWYMKYWDFSFLLVIFFLISFLALTVINIKYLFDMASDTKYEINYLIYKDLLGFISNNDYYECRNNQLSKEDFSRMNLFNLSILNYQGDNFAASSYLGKRFLFCDTTLYDLVERIKTDHYYDERSHIEYITDYHYHDKIDIFKGLYYETTINRDNNEYIYLIPNNIKDKFIRNNIDYYISYKGVKVELENLDFSEKYSVYSLDETKSRYVLSLTFMEKINLLDNFISNKKYLVFMPNGRVSIFIENLMIEDFFHQKFSLRQKELSQKYVVNYFEKVLKLFQISDILEDVNTFGK